MWQPLLSLSLVTKYLSHTVYCLQRFTRQEVTCCWGAQLRPGVKLQLCVTLDVVTGSQTPSTGNKRHKMQQHVFQKQGVTVSKTFFGFPFACNDPLELQSLEIWKPIWRQLFKSIFPSITPALSIPSGVIQLSSYANYFLIILPEVLLIDGNFQNEILEEVSDWWDG